MTEPTASATEPLREPAVEASPPPPRLHSHRPNRLYQAAAWVAIVAGTLFIVGAIFFTGFVLGRHSGPGWGGVGPRPHGGMMIPRFDRDADQGRGMMGPGMMTPGMRPDGPSTPVPPPPPGR